MRAIRNKLREKSGMSILMALIFFLVSMMVGTVVLAASTAAAGKLHQQQQIEQDYLNVASAARLVKNRICALTYTYTYKTYSNGTVVPPTDVLTSGGGGNVILKDELLGGCRAKLLPSSYPHPATPPAASGTEFTIKPSSASPAPSGSDWETVHGKIEMDGGGNIQVTLWLGDPGKEHNKMKVEFLSQKLTETAYQSVANPSDPSNPITITTITITCKWPQSGCTITKGT